MHCCRAFNLVSAVRFWRPLVFYEVQVKVRVYERERQAMWLLIICEVALDAQARAADVGGHSAERPLGHQIRLAREQPPMTARGQRNGRLVELFCTR